MEPLAFRVKNQKELFKLKITMLFQEIDSTG